MNILYIGSGFVGACSAAVSASSGHNTLVYDIDKNKIDLLNKGKIPIFEPGLDRLVEKNVSQGRLFFSNDLRNNLKDCDIVFSAVGTPPDEDGGADLQYVLSVAHEVGKYMEDYLVVITKSTVPIGTAKLVKEAIQEELDKRDVQIEFDVTSNPEFLKEGDAIDDFLKPDRIVVGVESARAEKIIKRLYKPFLLNGHPLYFMDIPSAELTKYAANSMLATKISFMNEMANLCEIVGADIGSVRRGIGSDSRIGQKFLYAGVGYGGSCFPKDVKALIKTADQNKYNLKILKSVEKVNDRQKSVLFDKIMKHFNSDLKGKKFAMWGLAFKPNTDDMREAPALVMIDKLVAKGAKISAYDPVAIEETKRRIGRKIDYSNDSYETLLDADALIIMTEWSEFRNPNFRMIKKLLTNSLIFDGRNIFDLEIMQESGFEYYSIGRGKV